jgi:putative PEP-CTERM system TPR-repeat lipoprotein
MVACGGKTKEDLYAQGVKQISKKNPDSAIIYFKSALEKDQNFFDARYELARAYLMVGKYEQAEKEFQKGLRQNPSKTSIRLDLAKTYCFEKKPDLAINEAEEYLKSNPGSPDAFEVLGIAYSLAGKPDKAESYLLQALKTDPARIKTKLELASLYIHNDKETETRRLLGEIIKSDPKETKAYYMLATLEISKGNRDKALEIYKQISEMNPSDPQAPYRMGMMNIDKGDLVNADKIADDLTKRFPKRAEGRRLKGIIYYHKKNYAAAIPEIQASIKIMPAIEAYYFLGLSYFEKKDLETALSQFRTILDHDPSFSKARVLTAMILLQQKRIDDAISQLKILLESDPKNSFAHNVLGSAYLAKGMADEGLKELNRAIDLDPKNMDALLQKGIVHLRSGKEKEAETDLETAVRVSPEVLNTRLVLGAYYMRKGQADKAISVMNKGLTGKKGDAPLYNFMASIMFSQKKQADALRYLQKAKEIDPESTAAAFSLAVFYTSTGDHEKAMGELRYILQKEPNNVRALLSMAALFEQKGQEKEAFDYLIKAKETKTEVGYLTLAIYYIKKKETRKALSVMDEALKALPQNMVILDTKGSYLTEQGKYKDALKVYDEIEAINPDKGLSLKIRTYLMMKDYSKAEELARRITTQKPNSAVGFILLSAVFENQNNFKRAIEEAKNGLRAEKDSLPAMLALGNLYTRKKDFKSAADTYNEALRTHPDNPKVLECQALILESSGNINEAIKKYQTILAKNPDFVPAINNLAYLYLNGHGSPLEGLRLAFNGYRLDPNNPVIMDTLGYGLLKNGRNSDAQKVLEKAVVIAPNQPTIAYHLALAYKQAGAKDMSIKTLQKSLSLGDFPESESARKLLDELKR